MTGVVNKTDMPDVYMQSHLETPAPQANGETNGSSNSKLNAIEDTSSPYARSTSFASEARESSASTTVDLSAENSALKAENKALKSSIKTGAANLFTALSVFSGGPWAALAQPLFKVAVNAVSKAVNAFKSEAEGSLSARFQKAAGGFIESVKSDFSKTMSTLNDIRKGPLKFFANSENAAKVTKVLGTVGAVVGGLIGAAIFSGTGPLGMAIGAGIGSYLGKLAGEKLTPAAANGAQKMMDKLAERKEKKAEAETGTQQTSAATRTDLGEATNVNVDAEVIKESLAD